jgi:hypothetical protein
MSTWLNTPFVLNFTRRISDDYNRDFLDHLAWLKEQAIIPAIFRDIPDVKLKQFAAEARSLDAASMNDLTETKRLTLAATLVFTQTGRALDDVADMYVRLVQRLHNQARTALLEYQAEHVERTDSLVATLRGVTLAYRSEGSAEQRLSAIGELIEPNGDRILEQCEAHQATAGRNYLPFLTRFLLPSTGSPLQFSGERRIALDVLRQKHDRRHQILDCPPEEPPGPASY